MNKQLSDTLLLAIKYIEAENENSLRPYTKTITSFLIGAKKSPFYAFYSKHPDVCGRYPNATEIIVQTALISLELEGKLRSEVSKSGKTGYYLVKEKRKVTPTKKIEDKQDELYFYESANESEKKILRQFKKLVSELLPDHVLQNNKSTYGFAPTIYEGEYPKKRCWISRDSKTRKLNLKFKKEVTSSEKVLPLTNEKQITEAFRQLRVNYSTAYNEIEQIVNRIKNKDNFEDYVTTNLKDIDLMPHQKAGVELSQRYNRFAFFYDTGTGKTIMALEIIMQHHLQNKARFLIVAPKALIKNAWMEDSEHFKNMKLLPLSKNITKEDYARIYDRWEEMDGRTRWLTDESGNILEQVSSKFINEDLLPTLMQRADHFIINIDAIREPKKGNEFLNNIKCDGMIIDESAIIKNRDSGNAIRMRVFAKKMKYVYLLSGKPAPNSTIEYFPQMEIIDSETFNMTYDAFVNKYFKRVGFGKIVDKNDSTRKEVAKMVGNRSIVLLKEDCIKFPPATHRKISVELDSKTADFYSDIIWRFVAEIKDMNGKKIKVQPLSKLASIMKLREVASGFYLDKENKFQINMHKVNVIRDLIDEIGYDKNGIHNKVLIWCTFKHEIQTLENELSNDGFKVVTAYSETKSVDESVQEFQKGDADILIAHPQTLKYGVTLTNCHYCIFSSMSYSYDDYYQAHDRIYRKGQKELCVFYHILSEDTIDENIYKVVVDKANRSKIFESLVKSASKHGVKREIIDDALMADGVVKNTVVSVNQLEGYSSF